MKTIAYHHEAFIAQSIQSVLAQRYDGLMRGS
jgi:hypothetical protein